MEEFLILIIQRWIHEKDKLIITGGTFKIKAFKEGSNANFNKNLYSAKVIKIKASTNETSDISLIITGGNFNLNTVDDFIHFVGNITITGGETFELSSDEDAIYADQYLILGKVEIVMII